jgi:CDP-4-dehydro-6-deoxyglucose reductase
MIARLVESTEIAPAVRHFIFETDEEMIFVPGQFVSFTAEVEGKEITRAYSLAAPPSGTGRFELCLNEVEGGRLSPYLFAMKPGDAIGMRPPLGTFILRHPTREALFIATGTGIAPFRAMLQAHLTDDSPPFTLLFGVRYEHGLLYRAQFEALAARYPQFRFWPTITRPEPSWTGRTGRIQAHLPEAVHPDLDVYLCGLREMVDDARMILKGMGLDRKQIFSEKYD